MMKENIITVSSPTLSRRSELQENTSTAAAAAASKAAAESGRLTSIHVTALDSIVSVNSLFTMAMFIGLSMTSPENATTTLSAACTTGPETVRRLIVFEVISFSFYLFSSLVAQSLKLRINMCSKMDPTDPHTTHVHAGHLKYSLFASAVGSVLGCTFLILSIVDFITVKLGSLSCGGKPLYAAVALVVMVGSGLLIYVITTGFAAFFVQEEEVKYEEVVEEVIAAAEQNKT